MPLIVAMLSPTSVSGKWTKDTIEKPGKREEYATRYTVYTDAGDQIYDEDLADAVFADLHPLKEKGLLTKLNKIDSDPAKNPQAPEKFQR